MEGRSGHPGCFGSASCHMQGPCEHSGTGGEREVGDEVLWRRGSESER